MVSHTGMPFILTPSYYFRYFHHTIFTLILYISIYNLEGLFQICQMALYIVKNFRKANVYPKHVFDRPDCGNATVLAHTQH